jgi:hypothetical protein
MPEPNKHSDPAKQDQGRKLEKFAVLVAALAAFASAGAAGTGAWQASIASDTEKRQLRAYVGVESLKVECPSCNDANYVAVIPVPGAIIKDFILVTVRNSGTTPARKLKVQTNWTRTPWGNGLPENFDFPDSEGIVVPGISHTADSNVIIPNTSFVNHGGIGDARDFISAREKKIVLFIYGHIDYIDIFDKLQTTTFCYVYAPWASDEKMFMPYYKHNDIT